MTSITIYYLIKKLVTGEPMTFDPSIREFLTAARLGVVCTIRPDGRPRQSVTYYILDGDRVLISTESKRGKARDVIRDGWASICVMGQEAPYPSVTVEGPACIRTAGIGQATARIFAAISGNQAAPLSDEDLARLDRVVLEITCAQVYGASHLPAAE
jgi:PPOX class probable F420-dependent enzyme